MTGSRSGDNVFSLSVCNEMVLQGQGLQTGSDFPLPSGRRAGVNVVDISRGGDPCDRPGLGEYKRSIRRKVVSNIEGNGKGEKVIAAIIEGMRPRQWSKNVFLFAALVFSQNAFSAWHLGRSAAAFFVFCLLSGAVYLVNDATDAEEDRLHPVKRLRPIASGRLSGRTALVSAAFLAALGCGGAFFLGRPFLLASATYLVIQAAYIKRLKQVVILDAFCVASGFVIRIVAGAYAIDVPISNWLWICAFTVSLFLAFCKRRNELVLLEGDAERHRAALGEYNEPLLDQMIAVVTSATIISYCLYTISEETVTKFATHELIYTTPYVLFGVFRYLYLVYRKGEGGAPEVLFARDPLLLANAFLYALTVGWALYL